MTDDFTLEDAQSAIDNAPDPPADHIALFDGPPMRAAVDCPAEGTNGDEGPYTEDQIRETFERLGDSTNQDDFMYNLRWGGPDWSNFMKARPSTSGAGSTP